MNAWIEFLGLWLADFYLAATILLSIAALLFAAARQPARRMAIAWGSLLGLLIACGLCLSPSRPRLNLRPYFSRPEPRLAETELPIALTASPPVAESAPRSTTPPVEQLEESAFERIEPPLLPPGEQSAQLDAPTSERASSEPASIRPAAVEPAAVEWGPRLVAFAVWSFLAGALAMASWLIVGVVRASRLVRRSRPASGICCDELRQIAGPAARLPRLRINGRLMMPVATGTLRPAILLPEQFAQASSRHELTAVLAHEWTHIKNGDLWLLAFDRVVLALLWAHPLYWWTRRRIRTNQEFLADAAAATQIGPADYAALLVDWARKLSAHRGLTPLTAVGIWERPAALEQRVTEILSQNHALQRCSGRVRAALLVCLAGLGLIATSLSLRPPLADSAPPSASPVPTPVVQNPLADAAHSTAAKSHVLPADPPNSLTGEIVFEHELQSASTNGPKAVEDRIGKHDIGGVCVDEAKAPVVGAQISLYRVNYFEYVQQLVQQTSTDAAGRFRFGGVLANASDRERFVVLVRKDGFASIERSVRPHKNQLNLSMPPAVTMKGTVRNQQGAPVADALVEVGPGGVGSSLPWTIEGVRSARTDAWGEFVVRDVNEFHYAPPQPPPNWRWGWGTFGPPWVKVIHRDYVRTHVEYKDAPGRVDIVLSGPPATIEGRVVSAEGGKPVAGVLVRIKSAQPRDAIWEGARTAADGRYRFASLPEGSFSLWVSQAPGGQMADPIESLKVHPGQTARPPLMRMVNGGVLQGQVIDSRTGRPAAGVRLVLQGIDAQIGQAYSFDNRAKTNADGEYRFTGLPTGKFNVLYREDDPNVTAAAIDSLEVRAPQGVTAPPIRLIPGCLIKGRIIDDDTGKQLTLREGEHLDLQSHGSASPRSGAAVSVADVRKDGSFEIRLPPGEAWLAVRAEKPFGGGPNVGGDLTVPESGELKVEYHVRRYPVPNVGAAPVSARNESAIQRNTKSSKAVDDHVAKDEIRGTCMSQDELHLAGVEVTLYTAYFANRGEDSGPKLVEKTTTNDRGQFVFRNVPELYRVDGNYLVLARQPGRATVYRTLNQRPDRLDLKMWWSSPFKGTVKDADGKPVVGALVRCEDSTIYALPEGIQSARTNARGEFEIDDVFGIGNCLIEHPNYARRMLNRVPFTKVAELKLSRGGVVEGQVVDTVTGKPAAGLSVHMQPISRPWPIDDASLFSAAVKTDKQGRYRIGSIPTGKFNVFVSSVPGRASVALDSLAVEAGQLMKAPPICLVKGGLVKGRLVDDATGQPALVGENEPVKVGVYGPSRPHSGAAIEGFAVKTDGIFELRLPPGKNSVYLSGGPFLVHKPGHSNANQDIREIDVKEGEETTIEFRVSRQLPIKHVLNKETKSKRGPGSGAVTRSVPVALAEAPSASAKIVDYHVGKGEIGGLCLGKGETRHSGVEVSLYLETFAPHGVRKHELLGRKITNEQGQFLFTNVRALDSGEARRNQRYVIVGRRKGLDTGVSELNHSHDWVDLRMQAAVPVRGSVKDEQGRPVVGALVCGNGDAWRELSEGFNSARTDAQGQFQIDDVLTLWGLVIQHPDYPPKALYDKDTFFPRKDNQIPPDVIKFPLNVTLVKGSVVEGQVIDSVTGRPGGGLSVTMRAMLEPPITHRILFGEDPHLFSAETQTDKDGHYRFTRVPAARFDVYLSSEVPGRASIAIHSLEVPAASTVHPAEIRLVQGGVVRGRLIDHQSGEPMSLGDGESVIIHAYGPPGWPQWQDHPLSFPVQRDGTFELRLPPGKNTLQLTGRPYFAEKPADRNAYYDFRDIEIEDKQQATVEFRVVRLIPKKEKSAATAPKTPLSAVTSAAKPEWFNVRAADLGGTWYSADGQPIFGAKVTLVSTDPDGSQRKVLKATMTNSWGQFLFVCTPCLAGPNQHYGLVLSRDGEASEVRDTVQPGKWLELRAVRQTSSKKRTENAAPKLPLSSSGGVVRPAPIAVAEAPTVSPKIVDYHLEKESVGGLCLHRGEARIAGVEVSAYIIHQGDRGNRLIGRTITNDAGQFVFQHVPQLTDDELYLFIAKKKGLATGEGTLRQRHDWVDIGMGRPGVTMNGVVRDEEGKPIAGALLSGWLYYSYAVPEAAPSARTNERGEFQIDDLGRFGECSVTHPDYLSTGLRSAKQNPVEVVLQKACVVRGQVIDGETRRPVAGARVTMQWLGHVGERVVPPGGGGELHGHTVTTDLEGRYQFRGLGPGAFALDFRGGPGGAASASIDKASVGPKQTLDVPPVRLAKGGNVTVRLVDTGTHRLAELKADETVVIGIRSADGSVAAKPRLETHHMRDDGTIGVWLPAGKYAIFLAGGPFFSIGDVREGMGHDVREVNIKGGEEPTVAFRVVRIPQAGGVQLPDRLGKPRSRSSTAALTPNNWPSAKEVLSYLPANVAKWLASRPETDRDRMQITVEQTTVRTGDCRFYPLVGPARLQERVFKCSVALDKIPHADGPLDIQETVKTPSVFYMQQNYLVRCGDSVARR